MDVKAEMDVEAEMDTLAQEFDKTRATFEGLYALMIPDEFSPGLFNLLKRRSVQCGGSLSSGITSITMHVIAKN